jgi:Ser/Thr protein kinase RdoA (MazF antagonist)
MDCPHVGYSDGAMNLTIITLGAGQDFGSRCSYRSVRVRRLGGDMSEDRSADAQPERDDRLDPLARGALTAAVRVAREFGIDVVRPRVLSNEQNLLVHLSPSPVVARVATRITWSRPDPAAWLAREIVVAAHAAKNGGPVVPPTAQCDPGPHRRDGYDLTLWTYVVSTAALASEAEVGEALARLHLSLRDFPRDALPDRLPVHAQIENSVSALEREKVVDALTIGALRDLHEQLSSELPRIGGTDGVLHGDAHPWNLLSTEAGWRWIDLEETGFGPLEFDLAVLASKIKDVDAAISQYASTMKRPVVQREVLAPFQRIRELETVVWGLGMAVMDPTYREAAQDRLRRLLHRPS